MNELFQSDVMLFGAAMLGIAVTSVAILLDYLPHEDARPRLTALPDRPLDPYEKRAA